MRCLIAVRLRLKIIQAQGDYVWTVKDNEATLRQDIEVLFQPHRKRPGTSAPPMDFRTASTIEKGHGRMDKRSIIVSNLLADSSDWPEASPTCSNSNGKGPTGFDTRTHKCALA